VKTVLITGIGGDIAQSVATIIKENRPDIRLVGTDMNLKHGGSLFVNEVLKVPNALSEGYLNHMREIIKSYSIDVVIPMTEPELSVFTPLIDELGKNRCITAGQGVLAIGLDKLETTYALESLGIPTPWSVRADTETPSEFPCIFKAQLGSGSKNVFVVETHEEAVFLARKFPNSIFQELLEPADKEVTCAVYRRRDGQITVLQLLRKLTGGLTGWAKVIDDRETFVMCKEIAKGLDLNGSMNVQLRLTKNGPRVFEINPRFSSTVLMRHHLGFCDLLWALDEAQGLTVDFPNIAVDQCMVRIQDVAKLNN
jgi:carbamoyl-phosphate synthase large subunit